ncbi:MAG: hypothetical protein J5842_08105 [Lachnospiraceae bacterium]|nr:hypothetical protein [Lachnospiraceae bacterium]
MDALSIMSELVPGTKDAIDNIVNNINTKRDAVRKPAKAVRLSEFGETRAKQAKEEREKKNQPKDKKAPVLQ